MSKEDIRKFFTKHHKMLMVIPILITIIALISIFAFYKETGDLFKKDITLKGGISVTLLTDLDLTEDQIKQAVKTDSTVRKISDLRSGKTKGFIIEVSDFTVEQLKSNLQALNIELNENNFSFEETEPKLGQAFYRQLIIAVIFAFILMGTTVFITFRTFYPSIAVIFSAFADITITLAVINFLGMEISTAGIIGFLLVIGYAVDTDILLTTWAIRKKEGYLFDRMFHSMKTGLTMTFAAVAVTLIGLLVSNSLIIKEMFTVIFIALLADIITTYLTNTGILWIYCKKKNIT